MEGRKGETPCKGKPELFDLTERESNFRRDIKSVEERDRAIRSHNKSKFAAALVLCESCPVKMECKETASIEDSTWTVRGGVLPSAFKFRGRGRPRTNNSNVDIANKECSRGHVGYYRKRSNDGYRCMKCRQERERPVVNPKEKITYLPGTCSRGHVDKFRARKARSGKQGLRYCGECNRVNRNKLREKAKAAIMES